MCWKKCLYVKTFTCAAFLGFQVFTNSARQSLVQPCVQFGFSQIFFCIKYGIYIFIFSISTIVFVRLLTNLSNTSSYGQFVLVVYLQCGICKSWNMCFCKTYSHTFYIARLSIECTVSASACKFARLSVSHAWPCLFLEIKNCV